MGRLLFFAVLGVIAYWLLRRWWRRRHSPPPQARLEEVDMVKCAYCGVHLPKPEAIREGEAFYCCHDHRPSQRQGPPAARG